MDLGTLIIIAASLLVASTAIVTVAAVAVLGDYLLGGLKK